MGFNFEPSGFSFKSCARLFIPYYQYRLNICQAKQFPEAIGLPFGKKKVIAHDCKSQPICFFFCFFIHASKKFGVGDREWLLFPDPDSILLFLYYVIIYFSE